MEKSIQENNGGEAATIQADDFNDQDHLYDVDDNVDYKITMITAAISLELLTFGTSMKTAVKLSRETLYILPCAHLPRNLTVDLRVFLPHFKR